MAFTVGSLKVRHVRQYTRETSGLLRPRFFRGSDGYLDRPTLNKVGWEMAKKKSGLYTCFPEYWTDAAAAWDQLSAEDHRKACKALDHSPAGTKARELLFSILTPEQERTARRFNYFDIWLYNPYVVEDDLKWNWPVRFDIARFVFERGYPNGNIKLYFEKNRYSICLHPIAPYPNDDIVLAQYMTLLTEPDELIKQGNLHDLRTGQLVRFNALFGSKDEEQEKLIVQGMS